MIKLIRFFVRVHRTQNNIKTKGGENINDFNNIRHISHSSTLFIGYI